MLQTQALWKARIAAMLLSLCFVPAAGCAPAVDTGDRENDSLINKVVSREALFYKCVEVTSQPGWIYVPERDLADRPHEFDPPIEGLLHANMFSDPDAAEAVRAIAVPRDVAYEMAYNERTIDIWGTTEAGDKDCRMSVGLPTLSGRFAFVDYFNPSGIFGVYVFEKDGERWRVNERIEYAIF